MSIDPLVENAVNRVRKELITRTDNLTTAINNNTSGVSDLDLIAGENLTVGDPVSLGIDGKAYKSIGLLNNSNIASPLPLATTTKYLLDTVASKIIALGVNTADNNKLYTSVGTISTGGTLSWGAVNTHTMADAIGQSGVYWDAVRQSNNQLFLAYNRGDSTRCRILGYSGTTTTAGTESSLVTSGTPVGFNLVADSTGRVLVCHIRNPGRVYAFRSTVSGTTITNGTESEIVLTGVANSGGSNYEQLELLYDSTTDRAILAASYQVSTTYYVDVALIDFSSTVNRVALSNLSNHGSSSGTLRFALSRVSSPSSYAVRYPTGNSTSDFRIFTISTAAFTLGTAITLPQNANDIQTPNWVEDTVNNKIIFGFDSNGCAVYTRSGTALTLQATYTNINLASTTINFCTPYVVGSFSSLQQIYDFSGAIPRQVGTLNIFTNALTSQARLLTSTSGISYSIQREAGSKLGSSLSRSLISGKITNENQIGVSTQTVSAAATVKVRLKFNKTSPAKIVAGLSGLTPSVHYYLNSSGVRDIAGANYLGYAKSATELILSNPNGAET